ncbi:MAG: PAS domain S-box protein [Dehalococcoidia bacterium]|nr:PAS domain S-box protein [Dehalococcoidia bacterium]
MAITPNILIVDDDPKVRKTLSDILNAKGYAPTTAGQGKTALDMVKEQAPDVILIDLKLEDMPGLEVMAKIRKHSPGTECIVLTGYATQASAIEAVNLGAYGYVQKPCDMDQLLAMIHRAIEKREAEEALRQSEHNYKVLFESTLDGTFVVDAETMRLVLANQAAAKMYGFDSVEDGIGVNPLDYIHPDDRDRTLRTITEDMFEKDLRQVNEFRTFTKDGREILASVVGTRIEYQGRLAGLISVRDITERKRVEEALRYQEQYFRSLIENASDAVVILNGDGIIRYQSPSYGRVLGYRPEEEIDRDMFDYIHPDDAPNIANEFARLLQHPGLIVTTEVRFQHKDGSWHVMEATANNLLHDPAVEGIVVNFRDITKRKRAEEQVLQRNRELTALHHVLMAITQTLDLQEVLDEIASQAGVALGSEYTSIVTVNEDGSLGTDSETFVDIPPLSIRARPDGVTRSIIISGQPVVVDNADAYEGTNPTLISAGIKSYAGAPIKTKDVTTGVLFVHSRQPNAFADRLGLLTDLASQAAIAIENARLYKEASTVGALREADRLKTELLANVSHELRTPLTSIKGYCTSMLHFYDRLSDEDKRDSLEEINQASDRLTELIENLLQLSRLEAAGLHAEKEPTRIEPIISAALEDIQVKAKGYHFVTHAEESLPVIEVDPDRIRQVLENLLSNAVKCSPEGTEISVRCERKGQELVVSVRDQGVGIARKDIDRVFDRFYQVSPGLVQKGSGAGLGLTICKRIVEAHGGRIWAESKPKKGSTFIFTLPLTAEGKFQMLIPKS